eukprot:scaffold191_cov677-Pavlova_lutheri.AAC.19
MVLTLDADVRRIPAGADPTRNAQVQSLRAGDAAGQGALLQSRHSCAREGRRSRISSLCYPSGDCKGHRCLLPEVCRRADQARNQGRPARVRQDPLSCRSTPLRTEEVRWSGCTCTLPEVLPLGFGRVRSLQSI